MRRRVECARLGALALVFFWTASASAVILHPQGEPTSPPEGLDLGMVGRWSTNASAVALGPNKILTTRHQGGGSRSTVVFDGRSYSVESQTILSPDADLRVATISGPQGQPANLTQYAPLYTRTSEASNDFILTGFGRTRLGTLYQDGEAVGYTWSSQKELLWGTNRVDYTGSGILKAQANSNGTTYDTVVIQADFDALDGYQATQYEASPAEWDSGGGWFIQDNGTWKLAGLNAYLPDHVEDQHDDNDGLEATYFWSAERIWAVRISHYANDITAAIGGGPVPPGDANWDSVVDEQDLNILKANYRSESLDESLTAWRQGDFNGDEFVDFSDYTILAKWYGADWTDGVRSAPPGSSSLALPEPSSALVLLLTAGLWTIRRPSRSTPVQRRTR
jgi:hypothetical protein